MNGTRTHVIDLCNRMGSPLPWTIEDGEEYDFIVDANNVPVRPDHPLLLGIVVRAVNDYSGAS